MAILYSVQISVTGDTGQPFIATEKRQSATRFAGLWNKLSAGTESTTYNVVARTGATKATGTATMSSASGTVGVIINGITVTVTASGGDNNTASLLAAAINASVNPLVAGLVTASSPPASNVVTITSSLNGAPGNMTTLALSGTGVSVSGARLTGGVETLMTFQYP